MVNTIFKNFIDRFRKKKPEDEEKVGEASTIGTGAQISNKIRSYLEKELLIVRFLDWISEESFDFIFQQKIYDNYITSHTEEFLDVEKAHPAEKERISRLRAEYDRLNIKESAYTIKDHTEEVAKRNKIKAPYLKRFNRINMIIMGALIGTIFVFYIPVLRPYQMYSFLLILPVCFLPNYLKKQMQKKWNEFKYMHREELQEEIYEETNNLKIFIQLILDDARDYMLQENFPLQTLQFPLMSNDYLNIILVEEKIQQDQVQYLVRFDYPEGVEPIEVDTSIRIGGVGLPTATSTMDLGDTEDTSNDLFIILKNPQYDDDGALDTNNLDYVELGYKDIVETILENSDFDRIEDQESVIKNFDDFVGIHCKCGEPIKIGEIQKVTPNSYKSFQFYLMIGGKCEKCGANPFILSSLPNMEVPEELADIFIDPLTMEAEPDKSEDIIMVLRNVTYSEEKTLQLSDYTPVKVENVEKVDDLMENASFIKLNEPKTRFSDIDDFRFPLACEHESNVSHIRLGTSKKFSDFKFYVFIGEKCKKCNFTNYLLVPAPDEEIPEELLSIF